MTAGGRGADVARNDRTYIRQRDRLKRQYEQDGLPCTACGKPFLWEFENRNLYPEFWKDSRSFTADHIESINLGGRMAPGIAGLRGMHRGCNSRRGDGSREAREPVRRPIRTSREW